MPPPHVGKKAVLASGDDRIGALPDALLQHIISFLPAQEAVQTCVLARRWCDLWKSTTGLRITGGDVDELRPVQDFREFVDHLLLLRGCVPLDKCLFRVDVCSDDELPHVYLWIQHVLLCKVRLLELYIATDGCPAALGFCVGDLRLVSRHLTTLIIYDALFTDRFLDFAGCPSLEFLEICNGVFDGATKMSSKSLKCLKIDCCSFDVHRRTRIHVPNLLSLLVYFPWTRTPVLERMPLLREAVVRLNLGECTGPCDDLDCKDEYCQRYFDTKYDNSHDILLNGLSEAQELALVHESSKFIFKWDFKWCPTFSKLKSLVLNEFWCVPPEFRALACVLQHSPVLRNLTLQLFSEGFENKVEMKGIYKPMKRSAIISEQLEIVIIKCNVVDGGVSKVLKFLGTLNICFENVKVSPEDGSTSS